MAHTGKLFVARHHESEWNKEGLWTGSRDIGLTPYGFEMSEKMGHLLKGYCNIEGEGQSCHINHVFLSTQCRTHETYEGMLRGLEVPAAMKENIPVDQSAALNERDYGDYTGKNKWQVKKEIGDKAFDDIRRGWDVPVPHGETLKMVYERVVPYYLSTILPILRTGKNVLIVSSGNAIRSLMKYIESLSDAEICDVEMLFGGIVVYDVDEQGKMKHKKILEVESKVNA